MPKATVRYFISYALWNEHRARFDSAEVESEPITGIGMIGQLEEGIKKQWDETVTILYFQKFEEIENEHNL